ncbi:hypothetical protein KFK09_018644 [Dendrobium nobile]|uniref:ABC transporter family G domain-containing protein n=1 Tax=Dendrobium nobile TaxID=94219 RepID=A0A8T3AXM9_DENNO|nr:hypothetical protein KFK09_018644 [Dendrobium nobile]
MFSLSLYTSRRWSLLIPYEDVVCTYAVVLTLIATEETTSKSLANILLHKWALEAFVVVNAESCNLLTCISFLLVQFFVLFDHLWMDIQSAPSRLSWHYVLSILRLSADLSKADKVLVVERIIESLGLQTIRESLVGTVEKRGISGGQRKRVNVGLEMVMEPSLLFWMSQPLVWIVLHHLYFLKPSVAKHGRAKGGITVYHGSVKKVEEYFSGLGINVPERVNPPDYYIDILEGIIKPNTTSEITCKQLPLRWMLHNKYDVPRDMLNDDATGDVSSRIVKILLLRSKHHLLQEKVGKQRLREGRIQGVDFLILCLAGVCLGTLAKMSDETFGSLGYTYTVIAVCKSSFVDNYIILVALVYCVTGIGYFFAIFFQPGTAQLWSALMPVVLTLIATEETTSKSLANICYTKWALEAFVVVNAERYSGVWLITRCGSMMQSDYDINDWALCIIVLILYGMLSRCIAFFCMVTVSRN